jgi:hypothetical protein
MESSLIRLFWVRSGVGTRGGVHRTPESGVIVRVVLVGLAKRRWEIGLRHPAIGIVRERRRIAVRVCVYIGSLKKGRKVKSPTCQEA